MIYIWIVVGQMSNFNGGKEGQEASHTGLFVVHFMSAKSTHMSFMESIEYYSTLSICPASI